MIRKNFSEFDPSGNVHLLFLALLNNTLPLFSHFQCLDEVARGRRQLSHLLQVFQQIGLAHPDGVIQLF